MSHPVIRGGSCRFRAVLLIWLEHGLLHVLSDTCLSVLIGVGYWSLMNHKKSDIRNTPNIAFDEFILRITSIEP